MINEINHYEPLPGDWDDFLDFITEFGVKDVEGQPSLDEVLEERGWYLNENMKGKEFRGFMLVPPHSKEVLSQVEFKLHLEGPIKSMLTTIASGRSKFGQLCVGNVKKPKTAELRNDNLYIARTAVETGRTRWMSLNEDGVIDMGQIEPQELQI